MKSLLNTALVINGRILYEPAMAIDHVGTGQPARTAAAL